MTLYFIMLVSSDLSLWICKVASDEATPQMLCDLQHDEAASGRIDYEIVGFGNCADQACE